MAKTLRPQNRCTSCSYTWHPRGKNLSRKCPNCGHKDVKVVNTVAVAAVGLVGWAVIAGLFSPSKPPVSRVTTVAPVVLAQGADQSTEVYESPDPAPVVDSPAAMDAAEASGPFAGIDPALRGEFPIEARIAEPRGSVVLQAGPSMMSRNMATVADGTPVLAKGGDGKWVQVYTPAGIGYVSRKELALSKPVGTPP